MLTTVLICCTCHFQSGSLFFFSFGFLCLQVSSVSNFHPDTKGWRWSLIYAHLFSCVLGREEPCKYHWRCSQWMDHTGFVQAHSVCFLVLHCSGCRVLCRALSKAGPGFHALLRSNLLRFGFSGTQGTLQGYRLCWACVLCPSQVWAAHATRCLVSALSQVGHTS